MTELPPDTTPDPLPPPPRYAARTGEERQRTRDNFARLFRAAKRRSGLSTGELAAKMGVNRRVIQAYASGRSMPVPQNAEAMTEIFSDPILTQALRASNYCKRCGMKFYTTNRSIAMYCSTRCKAIYKRKGKKDDEFFRRGEEIKRSRDAVEAFCVACSGYVCRTPECQLRSVSPLPLIEIQPRSVLSFKDAQTGLFNRTDSRAHGSGGRNVRGNLPKAKPQYVVAK